MPALRSAVGTSPIPVTIDSTTTERLPAAVEAALYFCCMEAVQNAAKHSGARSVSVRFGDGPWTLAPHRRRRRGRVRSGARTGAEVGVGLANMRDRLDAVGGTLTVESPARASGTTVTAVVPSRSR